MRAVMSSCRSKIFETDRRQGSFVSGPSFQPRRRRAGHDGQIGEPRKPGGDVFDETIGKRVDLAAPGTFKRQHRHPECLRRARRFRGLERRFRLAQLLRQCGISKVLTAEIEKVNAHAVLHFTLAEIAQARCPLPILRKIVGNTLREEDVPGIAAIHHPLRDVDSSAGDVATTAHVSHLAYRPAMNPHPHRNLRMRLERLGNLERAARRFRRAVAKDQCHSITRR
jgi:hypothetical protein